MWPDVQFVATKNRKKILSESGLNQKGNQKKEAPLKETRLI